MKKISWVFVLLLAWALPLCAASDAEMLQFISRTGAEKSEVIMAVTLLVGM